MDIANRITELRNFLGLNQAALAKKLGVQQSTISQWESGKRVPETAKLAQIAKALSVSLAELMSPQASPHAGASGAPLNFSQKSQRQIIGNRTGSREVHIHEVAQTMGGEPLPVRGYLKQGEHGYYFDNGDTKDWVSRPKELIGIEGAYAMQLRDYSMPPLEPGWWATFNPIKPVRVGDLVAVYLKDGQAMLKKLVKISAREVVLHQYNPDKDLIFKQSEIEVIHALSSIHAERPS